MSNELDAMTTRIIKDMSQHPERYPDHTLMAEKLRMSLDALDAAVAEVRTPSQRAMVNAAVKYPERIPSLVNQAQRDYGMTRDAFMGEIDARRVELAEQKAKPAAEATPEAEPEGGITAEQAVELVLPAQPLTEEDASKVAIGASIAEIMQKDYAGKRIIGIPRPALTDKRDPENPAAPIVLRRRYWDEDEIRLVFKMWTSLPLHPRGAVARAVRDAADADKNMSILEAIHNDRRISVRALQQLGVGHKRIWDVTRADGWEQIKGVWTRRAQ